MYKATQLSACVASARWRAGECSHSGGVCSVEQRALTLLNAPQDVSSHFYVWVISYHFSGQLVPFFIMGFNSLLRLFICQNLLFKSAIIQENDF